MIDALHFVREMFHPVMMIIVVSKLPFYLGDSFNLKFLFIHENLF